MAKQTETMRPGILVALRTTVKGGIEYHKEELENRSNGGEAIKKWETTKIVQDVEEVERANTTRIAAGTLIRKVCVPTNFGLLCLTEREAELDAAIAEAQEMAANHNESARITRIAIRVMKGRVAENDEQALRAIAGEVGDLFRQIQAEITNMDPDAIRKTVKKAQDLGKVLDGEQAEQVKSAVKAARKAATTIKARIIKKGEDAATVLAELDQGPIANARFSFLDLADETEADGDDENDDSETMPSTDLNRAANIEMEV